MCKKQKERKKREEMKRQRRMVRERRLEREQKGKSEMERKETEKESMTKRKERVTAKRKRGRDTQTKLSHLPLTQEVCKQHLPKDRSSYKSTINNSANLHTSYKHTQTYTTHATHMTILEKPTWTVSGLEHTDVENQTGGSHRVLS